MSTDSDNKLGKLKEEFQTLCLRISAIKNKKAQDETNNNPHDSKLDCEGCKNKQMTRRKKSTLEDISLSSLINPSNVRDINNKVIRIGDRVHFITKGLHNSTEGTMYKISKNGKRVTSWDNKGMPIPRAPYNLQTIRD